MSYSIVLHPDAESEIDDAAEWYRKDNEQAAIAFLEAVDRAIERISQNPLQFPIRSAPLRHAIVTGFPYFLLFRLEAPGVLVTTCVHFSRDPRHWR